MLLTIAVRAETYSSNDAENKQTEVRTGRTGSCLFCLIAKPKTRNREPFEPQLIATRKKLRAVGRSSFLFHAEWKIVLNVAEITNKTKYNHVMSIASISLER